MLDDLFSLLFCLYVFLFDAIDLLVLPLDELEWLGDYTSESRLSDDEGLGFTLTPEFSKVLGIGGSLKAADIGLMFLLVVD